LLLIHIFNYCQSVKTAKLLVKLVDTKKIKIAFIDDVREQKIKHAGIVGIPPHSDRETTRDDVSVLAEIIKIWVSEGGKNALRKHILYVASDGYRLIDPQGENTLLVSWDALAIDNDILDY
jgi:hypothetical protein